MLAAVGLFSSAATCDWCGAEIDGEPIDADGLRLCSQACLALKNAPPARSAPATASTPREVTREIAISELAIAQTELELYERLGDEAAAATDDDEGDFIRAQEAYIGLWRNLATVRDYLDQRVDDLDEFDEEHRYWLQTSDTFQSVTLHSLGGQRREVGVAMFHPENAERARRAIAALQRALQRA